MAGNSKGRRRRFGTVRQLPSGRFQARYPGPDGLLRPAPRTFASETDANVWLTLTEADIVRGTWTDPDRGRVPLGEYAAKWIAERPGLAPRTAGLYESQLRLHIAPTLGVIDLTDLEPAQVRSWRRGLLDEGVGAVTVAKCYRLLRAILNTAVEDDELIRRNPCRIKGAGSETSPERPVATPEQIHALAAALPERWRTLVLIAVATSLRWGELMALTRGDIDIEGEAIRVSKSVAEVGGQLVIGAPKSRAGNRTVAVPAVAMTALLHHLDKFAEAGSAGRVFVGPKGATPRRGNWSPRWQKAVKAAGLPKGFRFHDLRHTGNTWAAKTGANLRELMERMGHGTTRAAIIYLHGAGDSHRAIADGINGRLAGAAPSDESTDEEE